MNKLPEPSMSCYDNAQLVVMIEEASQELNARGWSATWNIKAPRKTEPKTSSMHSVFGSGAVQIGTTEQADSDLAIANAVGIIEGSGVVTEEDLP